MSEDENETPARNLQRERTAALATSWHDLMDKIPAKITTMIKVASA
ncbi:hypothetical protein [Candidatus Nitrospira neomarina]|uniref:Uncharacterized protein n=1 Tax=Candidatus Nitrospira neomarina TaxID=3020899 RepID=A0AA96GKZ2_9BACT|nr:hypothetical protein [Candidatus Nitrospira neomarina]WNM62927.1 hypothetical protein PQG83_04010 [Candidatus Nitrospira neomarina]